MSLLSGLIAQVAQSALQGRMGQNDMSGTASQGYGNDPMGSMLGSVLGGNMGGSMNGSGGMGDILGSVLGGGMGNNMGMNTGMSSGGMMGQVLGSILGGGGGFGGMGSGFGNQQHSGFSGKSMLMAALLPLALSFIQRNGGLSGALNKITGMGHSQQANSWMSTDQTNMPLDALTVSQLFDHSELQQVADQTGLDTHEVQQGMAQFLPQVFDNLTPNGDTDTEEEANNEISDILTQLNMAR